ncbi:MAG: glycosyltransferase family 8 protein [Muribaculaceae bacterium]|nr:glycosyltransferase family 8 protein [Muribaculaceae bacterium]
MDNSHPKIPIVFATDHNFVVPTTVAIMSLLKNSENCGYEIFIIVSDNVTDNDKRILEAQVCPQNKVSSHSITFLNAGEEFKEAYETRGVSNACYYRLMIPWLLPQFDKVIYSDSDVVFKGSLNDIFNHDLKGSLVAGVTGKIWSKPLLKRYLNRRGLSEKEYINSGFLLINSSLQRELNLKDEYLRHSGKKYVYQDQDIINIVCKGKIAHLPGEYNVKPKQTQSLYPGSVKILHFIGQKPWESHSPGSGEWWEYYKGSAAFNQDFYNQHKRHGNSLKKLEILFKRKIEKLRLATNLVRSR